MLKRLIGLSLLCVVGHSYAGNIIVNTTEDDNAANDKCSLREAITLLNLKQLNKLPASGKYQGCDGTDAAAVVVLESGKTYSVNSEISIITSVSILSLPPETEPALNYKGEKNAVVKATGLNRIFNINDDKSTISSILVNIDEVDLIGCAADKLTTRCAPNGGIIYNSENLAISYARISGGYAKDGGAIFNDGIGDSSSSAAVAGLLALTNVFMAKNTASEQGAAVYSAQPRYAITGSVFKENKVQNNLADASVVYVNTPVQIPSDTDVTIASRTAQIINSTFFDNDAFAANLRDAMVINNATIVRNRGGVYLNAQSGAANLSNSIVAENTLADCRVGIPNKATTNNLVFSKGGGCDQGTTSTNPNFALDPAVAEHKLFANTKIGGADGKLIEGECDKAGNNGLLCPFRTEKEIFNGYFKPRLLVQYVNLADSRIINRGRVSNDGSTVNTYSCAATDQRGKPREITVLCDIGSIELTIGDTSLVGKDITYGEIAEMDITDNLGDGELWPASRCEEVFGKAAEGTTWQEGCLTFVSGKEAKKGSLFLNSDALLKYTPFRNFHGLDNFSFRIMTTTSRFSVGDTDKTIIMNGAIVQSPPDTFENKTVQTSGGGSTGLITVLGLLGLAWTRRRIQGEE